ncbi:hypothetical protein [Pelagibius sp. Alg239-R121]|uniref:hypothetical protein n=1 Tax=Pelagibius sp. Alg239-R121 TaxID=2993448 RepID=UPI0024A69CC1|nr:hypothetical protein [Pelagibius sp. Alg239-R121]
MNSTFHAHRNRQPALGPNDPAFHATLNNIDRDMVRYVRRAHEARSAALFKGVRHLIQLTARLPRLATAIGDAIHTWLFTPLFSGGRKS